MANVGSTRNAGWSTFTETAQQQTTKEKILSSKQVATLQEIFGSDTTDILVNYAAENGLGANQVLDNEDLLPSNVKSFITYFAEDVQANNLTNLSGWYETQWSAMSDAEKELTVNLLESMLGSSIDIDALLAESDNSVSNAPMSDYEISAYLQEDPGNNKYAFTYKGDDYYLVYENNKIVCYNEDDPTTPVDSTVQYNNSVTVEGFLAISGIEDDAVLYIGSQNAEAAMILAPNSGIAGNDYESLERLKDEGEVLWTGTVDSDDYAYSVATAMNLDDLETFLASEGAFDFSMKGDTYTIRADGEGYDLFDANGNEVTGVDITLDPDDGILAIEGFLSDNETLYFVESDGELCMAVGDNDLSEAADVIDDSILIFSQEIASVSHPITIYDGVDSMDFGDVTIDFDKSYSEEEVYKVIETEDYVIAVMARDLDSSKQDHLNTYVYDKSTGELITTVWGDPHVDGDGDGSTDFNFYGDSTFVLPDGTKIALETSDYVPGSSSNNQKVVTGINIMAGDARYELEMNDYGNDDYDASLHYDRYDWDINQDDASSVDVDGDTTTADAGVFVLYSVDGTGEKSWACYDADEGKYYKAVSDGSNGFTKGDEIDTDYIISRSEVEAQYDENFDIDTDDTETDTDTSTDTVFTVDDSFWTLFDALSTGDVSIDASDVENMYAQLNAFTTATNNQVLVDGTYWNNGIYDDINDVFNWQPQPGMPPPGAPHRPGMPNQSGGMPPPGPYNPWGVPSGPGNALQGKWEGYIADISNAGAGAGIDVNALVMWVLRESYQDSVEDLHFYAEKVSYYNDLKTKIRDELTAARTARANGTYTTHAQKTISTTPAMDSNGNVYAADPVANGTYATTEDEMDAYIDGLETTLNSVGDDAQLANVDLQNMLQKQQQTLQMLSNISKMLHDTAMAIIRKIG